MDEDFGMTVVEAQLAVRQDAARRFEDALALARRVGWLSEGHNYWLDRMLQAHTRWFALRTGRRLVDAGVLDDAGDVFFLHADEVASALRRPGDLQMAVTQRKADHAKWSAIRPPKYLGAVPQSTEPEPALHLSQVLRGIAASPGVVSGPARIVRTPAESGRVARGDILVCPAANPSWVPLFPIIAGLITDAGGALSHAAVAAREFGIPAVVGTGEATQRIREGQPVEVNGTAGEVWLARASIET
jgi:pyruvate,water dikinase